MKYYTIDTEINFKQKYLEHNKIKESESEWFFYFLALIAFILWNVIEYIKSKEIHSVIEAALFFIWSWKYFIRVYKMLFVLSFKKYINYNEIVKIEKKELHNKIETEVIIILQNKRKRIYTFRTAEHVVDAFITELNKLKEGK